MKKTPDAIDVHVGARVRMRRTMMGMSQERLGDSLGISFQQVQKYEKGTNRIGASRLQNIATILDMPISFFFEGNPGEFPTGDDAVAETISRMMRSKECVELAMAFFAIENRAVQQKMLALMRSLGPDQPDFT